MEKYFIILLPQWSWSSTWPNKVMNLQHTSKTNKVTNLGSTPATLLHKESGTIPTLFFIEHFAGFPGNTVQTEYCWTEKYSNLWQKPRFHRIWQKVFTANWLARRLYKIDAGAPRCMLYVGMKRALSLLYTHSLADDCNSHLLFFQGVVTYPPTTMFLNRNVCPLHRRFLSPTF